MRTRWPTVKTPTDAENRELIRRSQAGDATARNECVRRNTPLALAMVDQIKKRWKTRITSHDQDDLIQEALIGLSEAIAKFDLNRDIRLSTYAYQWIRNKMTRWLYDHKHTVRVPRYLQFKGAEKHGPILNQAGRALMPTASIYDIHPGTGISYADDLPAREEYGPPEEYEEEIEALVSAISDWLTDKEREILTRRIYLGHTLAAIGEDFNLTKERVRQIEKGSLDILRRVLLKRQDSNAMAALKVKILKCGGPLEAAKELGVSHELVYGAISGRLPIGPKLAVALGVSVPEDSPCEVKKRLTLERVLQAVKGNASPIGPREVSMRSGITAKVAARILWELKGKGLVRRVGRRWLA